LLIHHAVSLTIHPQPLLSMSAGQEQLFAAFCLSIYVNTALCKRRCGGRFPMVFVECVYSTAAIFLIDFLETWLDLNALLFTSIMQMHSHKSCTCNHTHIHTKHLHCNHCTRPCAHHFVCGKAASTLVVTPPTLNPLALHSASVLSCSKTFPLKSPQEQKGGAKHLPVPFLPLRTA
jgi:hypothetical protein